RAEAWGTIFSSSGEHNLGGIEHARSKAWTEQDEAAYLDRVRRKAEQIAADLIAEARAEAENVRRHARQQGYDEGLAEASAELETFRAGMAESVSAVLSAIEGQCSHIFDQWREDITEVARLAVSRVTAIELTEKRREVLEALIIEAVGLLEKRRELTIRVNPEDEPVLNDIVSTTQERFADVKSWRVKADADISPGGMIVESESSLAEGRIESRAAAVDEVLKKLRLPEHPEQDDA
ncbi:MAG: flagellar assembly protein FliH, partial [Desulfovibrio sp.]|nr:flagellar assembly protein FliH [Desulfovibrio sp.]